MNAAIIYQYATGQADRAIANALDDQPRAGNRDEDPDQEPVGGLVLA